MPFVATPMQFVESFEHAAAMSFGTVDTGIASGTTQYSELIMQLHSWRFGRGGKFVDAPVVLI